MGREDIDQGYKGMFSYNFPEIAGNYSLLEQTAKIMEEAGEAHSAASRTDKLECLVEIMDIVQSCETALRKFGFSTVTTAADYVMEKNYLRGYYGEPEYD